jgi:cob(I)alamin adenosyltransferase
MKIYTKKGDSGETSLLGGTRVRKDHLRVEAYGAVDELNSWLGLIACGPLPAQQGELLLGVQELLFSAGSNLAADPESSRMSLPELRDQDTEALELAIDQLESGLPELKNFILPGGHPASAQVHIARCVCRRAERAVVHLAAESPVEPRVVRYLNRLSDYLFVLARAVSQQTGTEEIPWKPRA